MLDIVSMNRAGLNNGDLKVKFEFEFNEDSVLPEKSCSVGQKTYLIANGSTAKNITTNKSYEYKDGKWIKVVNTSKSGTTTKFNKITDNGDYNIPNNDSTGFNDVNVDVSGGGGSSSNNDVRFLDYDGTVVASYSATDFANLSTMPANPTHTGLTVQGWNWSLSDAKTYVATNGKLDIGQMYITSDGKTKLHIRLCDGRLKPYLGLTGAEAGTSVDIDWGDDSAVESVTLDTSTVYTPHEYVDEGVYVISISVTNGKITFSGNNSYRSNIFRKSATPNINNDITYQNILTDIEIGIGVTTIGQYAFYGCSSLSSITIPNSVTSIEQYAFQNCYPLSSITIPSSVTSIGNSVFYYCTSLSSITIPNSVNSIGNSVFQNCNSLSSITIPNSFTSIQNYTFYNCYSLTSISIPNGVTTIGNQAFYGCSSLSSITIPNGVTSIGDNAFYNCYSLTSISIPDGVTSIGNQAFYYCYSLSSITIPNSVTSIQNYAFYNCYSLTSISIPDGVTTIGIGVFYNCYALSSITIPDGVTSIGDNAFYNCYALSSITIPNSVTTIGSGVFYNCYTLSSITIPNTVTSIGNGVFQGCYSLTSIIIPNGVTTIGNSVFNNCYALSSITIPNGVTSIGNQAFYSCYGLGFIKFTRSTPPTVQNVNTFQNVPYDCVMLVPGTAYKLYINGVRYPSSAYTYLIYDDTYASGATLPATIESSSTTYNLTWYASIKDAIAQTNAITTGTGNEVYARAVSV